MIGRFINLNRNLSRYFSERNRNFVKGDSYKDRLLREIKSFVERHKFVFVLEAGGIDRPLLQKSAHMKYDGLDIEFREKCNEVYDDFFVQSIEEPLQTKYDVICSYALLEHVQDNEKASNVMFKGLNDGGMMMHYLPGKYHPYSLIARMLGHDRSAKLLSRVHPHTVGICGYPAYFHKCSVKEMYELCARTGFREIRIIPYYRANSYFEIFFPLFLLVTIWENICRRLGWSLFCSGFILIAKK